MEKDRYEIKRIGPEKAPAIKELFFSVFTHEPWNDDWSDQEQLDAYIHDLTGQNNSLTYGLYEGETLTGVSMDRSGTGIPARNIISTNTASGPRYRAAAWGPCFWRKSKSRSGNWV